MTEFLTVLAFTYLCNSTAELRQVSFDEARDCTLAYEQVKRHFHPAFGVSPVGTRHRQEQNIAAYLAFKQWEKENAEFVAGMKAEATRQAQDAMLSNG
ncbi:hypothetical protein [Aliiruegeria sabulilitoris]|uniref:hypothetical protein n=1 Tax=Aliiruegeria sabulilitoris TaxID=1510458 RepID=UPI00082E64CD|nr:hypothetical protein [Aliiruegeria sabulilitoris]NDR56368.1 hypothetical protein [Pseudoruegeria sp. M32A2M]